MLHGLRVCYTEKAPNAWQRRGTQKTTNTFLRVTLIRDLIRDDPRRGIRVMQVHAAAPCQH